MIGVEVQERRYDSEREKFATQRDLTFYVTSIFALVTAWVLFYGTVEQRSAIVQCWIGLAIGSVMYWIGTTKGAADNRDTLNKMLPTPPPVITSGSSTVSTTTEVKP